MFRRYCLTLAEEQVRKGTARAVKCVSGLAMSEKLCLQWNDFKDNINTAFGDLYWCHTDLWGRSAVQWVLWQCGVDEWTFSKSGCLVAHHHYKSSWQSKQSRSILQICKCSNLQWGGCKDLGFSCWSIIQILIFAKEQARGRHGTLSALAYQDFWLQKSSRNIPNP